MTAYNSLTALKSALDNTIKTNSANEITGNVMNSALDNIVDTLDALKTDKMVITATAFSFSGAYSTASVTISSTEIKKLYDYLDTTGGPLQEFLLKFYDSDFGHDHYVGFTLKRCVDNDNYIELRYININTKTDYQVILNLNFSNYNNSYTASITCRNVPFELAQLSDDSTHRLVTDTEKTAWNAKYDKPSGGIPATDIESGVIPTVPTISTSITADANSNTKTASPKAVKTYVDNNFEKKLAAEWFPSSGTLSTLGSSYTTNLVDTSEVINTETITLPSVSELDYTDASVIIFLTTGSTPNITIVSEDGYAVTFAEGFSLEANKIYEINALYSYINELWIVTAHAITYPTDWEE